MTVNELLNSRVIITREEIISGNKIVIYGKGSIGREVLKRLTDNGAGVLFFLDRNALPGEKINNVPVYSPNSDFYPSPGDLTVIIGVFNRDADIGDIYNSLSKKGIARIYNFMQFYEAFYGENEDHFWLTKLNYYDNLAGDISNGLNLFKEKESRELFLKTLGFRFCQNPDPYQPQKNSVPYYEPGFCRKKSYKNFVDCGAYDGDTLEELTGILGKMKKLAIFEPDPDNLKRLFSRIETRWSYYADEIYSWPCGVWSETTNLFFRTGNGEASKVCAETSQGMQLSCVALDDALIGFKPGVIKMDIEGSESEALNGAKKIIRKYKPSLVICVYHKPRDLWSIGELIDGWNLGYKFYLRCYRYNTFETVLYAIP